MALASGPGALGRSQRGDYRLPASPLHLPLAALAGVALISTLLGLAAVEGLKAWLVGAAYASFGYLYFPRRPCTSAEARAVDPT